MASKQYLKILFGIAILSGIGFLGLMVVEQSQPGSSVIKSQSSIRSICNDYQSQLKEIGIRILENDLQGDYDGLSRGLQDQKKLESTTIRRLMSNPDLGMDGILLTCADNGFPISGSWTREMVESANSENHPFYDLLESGVELTLDNLYFAINNGYSNDEIVSDSCQVYYNTLEALMENQITPSAKFKENLYELSRVAC